jgi:hypothetical protein
MLGLLAIYGPSTASAASLTIRTGGNIFTRTYTPCTTATLGVTYTGTANPTGSTKYPSIAITGLTGCEGLKLGYTAYGSNGQTVTSGTNVTVVAGTNKVTPAAAYDASLVRGVVVTVNGWPITNVWTGPPPAFPAVGHCDGVLMSDGQTVNTNCTVGGQTVAYSDYAYGYIFWFLGQYGISDVTVTFTTAFTPSNTNIATQASTWWRATFDLTAFTTNPLWGGHTVDDLSTHFYLYKTAGSNTTLAPGETCSDATKVTFQELSPTSNGTGGFIVSARQIPGKPATDLLCSK